MPGFFSTQAQGAALRRWLPPLLIAASVLALLPVLYVGIYNHPCAADDFQNAQWTDYFAFQRSVYLHWSGRYFNNLAATLCPLHWHSFTAYRAVVILIMAAFALSYALCIAQALKAWGGLRQVVCYAVGAMLTALLFNNFPSLSEGFFWFTGAATYVLPATAALLLFSLLLRPDGRSSTVRFTGAALLAAAAIGGNESMLLLCNAVVLGGALYYNASGEKVERRFYIRLLAVCALCSAIAILAPGNFARQAVLPRNVWLVLPTWLMHSAAVFRDWIADPFLLLCSALAFVLLRPATPRLHRLPLLATFLLPLGLILLLGLPAHYALGNVPPPRVMNMLYTFFLAGWMVFLLRLGAVLQGLEAVLGPARAAVLRELAVVAVLLLLLSGIDMGVLRRANVVIVAKSLAKGIPQAYDSEMRARYARIRSAPGDTVGVPPVRHQAGNVLYTGDIIALLRANTNRYYGAYFGKKVVFIDSAAGR